MEIKTSDGVQNVTGMGQGVYNTIAGSLGLASFLGLGNNGNNGNCGGSGLAGLFGGNRCGNGCVSNEILDLAMRIAAKDSEIALLKSEQNTENKIADVYERLITRINADKLEQAQINSAQAVANCQMSSAISVLQNSVSCLQNTLSGITKTVVPISAVCPQPMPEFNSWTAPTAPAA
jgi:hypothetical protein